MFEQVQEEHYHLYLIIVVLAVGIERRDIAPPGIEGIVQVEADEAETPVVMAAVGLDIIFRPVVVAEVEFHSHIVDKFVDVEQCLHLVVDTSAVDVLTDVAEVMVGLVVAILECLILESVNFLVVIAPVSVGELVIIGLAQVQHATELAVDIFSHLHGALHVNIETRALDDGSQGGVGEAGVIVPGIIAAIAYQQYLAADVGLLGEEGMVEVVQSVEHLVRFEFHRTRSGSACPSAGDAHVHILIEQHTFRRTDVTEIHRAIPVHVIVALLVLSISGLTIGTVAVAVDADLGVTEISFIAHDAHDGDGVFGVGLDVTAGHRLAGQVAVLEESEHEIGSIADGKLSGGRRTALRSGHTAVGGVAQGGTLRNLDFYFDGIAEQLAALIHHRYRQSFVSKGSGRISFAGCGLSRPSPFLTAVGLAGPGGAAQGFRVSHAGDEFSIVVTQINRTTVAVEFERRLVASDVVGAKPYHLETLGGNFCHRTWYLPERQVLGIIAQIHIAYVHGLVARVIQFYPTVEVDGRAYYLACVRSHQFVDDQDNR